jgi:hypothetical protein
LASDRATALALLTVRVLPLGRRRRVLLRPRNDLDSLEIGNGDQVGLTADQRRGVLNAGTNAIRFYNNTAFAPDLDAITVS